MRGTRLKDVRAIEWIITTLTTAVLGVGGFTLNEVVTLKTRMAVVEDRLGIPFRAGGEEKKPSLLADRKPLQDFLEREIHLVTKGEVR
jgi:hypothetical protein